jgi:uncharacterized protein YndB with AHSA1/START domain
MSEPVASASTIIRRPSSEVFDAFVRPEKLTQFWLTRASGPLAKNAKVEWHFMVPGATASVAVTAFEPPRHLGFDWPGMHVEMRFDEHDQNGDAAATRVAVHVTGFAGDNAVEQAVGTTEGFTTVLCDLKTLLESGHSAGLVRDKAALIMACG